MLLGHLQEEVILSKTMGRRLTNSLVNHRALPAPHAGVSPVLVMKELPNLLRGLEMFFQARGAGEPEVTRGHGGRANVFRQE